MPPSSKKKLLLRGVFLALLVPGVLALQGAGSPAGAKEGTFWVPNFLGTTGLVNTPTATVLPEGTLLFGLSVTEKRWAHYVRGQTDNWNYGFTVGFLERVELNFRVTYAPDAAIARGFENGIQDRGGAARLLVAREGRLAPAVAVGVDDVRGTKRFHSLYAVGTKEVPLTRDAALRVSLGYGSDVWEGKHPVLLDGVFGGGEVVVARTVSLALDNDTEKWSLGLRANLLGHVSVTYALLDFNIPSGSVAWFQRL